MGRRQMHHPTSQQALQPLLLAHRGGICPQSHFPTRAASSMHIFCMAEDTELCAEVGSEAAPGAETGAGSRRVAGKDPLAKLAMQNSGGLRQSFNSAQQMFFSMLETRSQLYPERDYPGTGLCASWAPQVFFRTISHLYAKVIFSTPHNKYCLEKRILEYPLEISTQCQHRPAARSCSHKMWRCVMLFSTQT